LSIIVGKPYIGRNFDTNYPLASHPNLKKSLI